MHKIFFLIIAIAFSFSAQAQETITITDEAEMKDALSIEDVMEVLSNAVGACVGDRRKDMELRLECLCKNTESLQLLKDVFDGVMEKHPSWRGNTLSFQAPIGAAEYRSYFFTMGPLEQQFSYLESCKE